ncbi:extracellular solute-binding protein [Salinadaptatus halalkaliphilus]|uniref:Extracellular solute-binding protein n=2 Tax=Salinadaptatus halalkaliphilus TaxID=2419781 RepID=A0A4S3TLA3_9EURY|nr:extracellular solute-binding protein [Salinadaptatus halalkaliphilus]
MSRRHVLQTGATVTGIAVAGCLGGGGDGSIGYISRGGTTQDTEREVMEQWSEESGVEIEHQEVADDTEMITLIAENPDEFDLTNPAPWGFTLHELEHDGELFAPIDFDQIPNYDDIADPWQNAPFIEGRDYGAFYYISTQGIGYNTDEIDEITSWDDIKDDDLDGQLALFDSAPARFGNSCANLGLDPGEAAQDDDLLDDVIDEMEEQHQNAFGYWGAGDQLMQWMREEQAYAACAWGGRIENLREDGYPMEYVIPDEGCVTWSTAFTIVEGTDMREEVHDLLNFLYEEENAIQLSTGHQYPIPFEDPPEEMTERADYTEHPDDLTWIDWDAILPVQDDLELAHDEIKAS